MTIIVRCENGHDYSQRIHLRLPAQDVSLFQLFRIEVPCCGVCGERNLYSIEVQAGAVVPVRACAQGDGDSGEPSE